MRKTKQRDAFFLLEAMLTIAILSIGLVFVIRSINTSLLAAKAAFNYSRAMHFVAQKADEFELQPGLYNLGADLRTQENGIFEADDRFRWSYVLEKFQDYALSTCAVDVAWKEGKREGNIVVTTYVRTYNVTGQSF